MLFSKFSTLVSALALVIGMVGATNAIAAQSEIGVQMNMARILRLPSDAATVVIGSPAVLDAVIQDPRTLVLTGKGFGSTNLIALDSMGHPIVDLLVNVGAESKNLVTVFQGIEKTSVSCSPVCQPMALGGDSDEFVDEVISSLESALQAGGN